MSKFHSAEEEDQMKALLGTIDLARKLVGGLFPHPCPFNKSHLKEVAALLKAANSIAKRASYWPEHES